MWAAAVLVVLGCLLVPATVDAQTGGEAITKTTTEHFAFVYRKRYAPVVRQTIEGAESARTKLLADLGGDQDGPVVEVRFARNIEEMRTLCPRQPPGWADAVAFWPDNIIVISLTTNHHRPVSLDTVFRHELSHVALRWVVGDAEVPRWFNEGLAIVESGELPFKRLQLLWPGAARGQITPLKQLERRFPTREFQANQAYAESADFVRFLARYRGRWRFQELLQRLRRGENFYGAMSATWGESVRDLERAWHRDVRRRYSVVPTVTAGMTLWVAVACLAFFTYIKRRRDIRRRINAMADDEESDDRKEAT